MSQLRIYTDGRCPFCQWSRRHAERYDRDRRLDFRDYNQPAIAAETPFSLDDLSREMHVLAPDGIWHAGFFGWIAILRVLPRWRWLASILALPPVRWIGPGIYRAIARNRYRAPRFLLQSIGAPPPCDDACALPPEHIANRTIRP